MMARQLEGHMADDREQGRRVFGALLIVLGTLMLLSRLDLPGHWEFEGLWPVLLIVLGVGRFVSQRSDGRPGAGLGLALAGLIFLLHTQEVMSLRDSWPLFIVGAGLSILAAGWVRRDRPTKGVGHE